jgi:hypothetical protein
LPPIFAPMVGRIAQHRPLGGSEALHLLMGWSGRAPAPPATNLARGSKDKGARHVPELQQRSCRDRH